jgi:hypothetical protein
MATGPVPASAINTQSGQSQNISSIYSLINAYVDIPSTTPNAPATRYASPLNDPAQQQQLLPLLFDQTTTVNAAELPPRVNVNTASATVLATLPGLQQTDVQAIIAARPDPATTQAGDPTYQTPAWLITRANLSPATLQSVEKYITTTTQTYRFQAVGYFDGGGPSARIEAVVDTNMGNPRILYYRPLSDLGRGFDLGQISQTATTAGGRQTP